MDSVDSSGALGEAEADALLSGRPVAGQDDLGEIVALMRTAAAVPAPTPRAALADLLEVGLLPAPAAPTASRSRRARWSVRIAAMATAALSVTMGAATANALPAPVQTAVAKVVGAVTPLQLPLPGPQAPENGTVTGRPDGGRQGVAGVEREPAPDQGRDERSDPSEPAVVASPTPPAPEAPAADAPRRPAATPGPSEPSEDEAGDVDDPGSDDPGADEADPPSEADDADEPEGEASQEADEGLPDDGGVLSPAEPDVDREQLEHSEDEASG